jgi:hypothetical protein
MLLRLVPHLLHMLTLQLGPQPSMTTRGQHGPSSMLGQQSHEPSQEGLELPSPDCGAAAISCTLQGALLWVVKCLGRALQQLHGRQPGTSAAAGSSTPSEGSLASIHAGVLRAVAALMVSMVDDATQAAAVEVRFSSPNSLASTCID